MSKNEPSAMRGIAPGSSKRTPATSSPRGMFESPRAATACRLAAAILWGVCAWGLPGPASAVQWTRVLGSGDLAPGFENGTQVELIGGVAPRLADDGELIFTASMGTAGDPASGTPEGVALGSRLDWVRGSLNASGQIAIRAALDDGSDALYRWDPGLGLTLLASSIDSSLASALFVAQVPEPGSLASFGVAVSALGWVAQRRRRLRLRS